METQSSTFSIFIWSLSNNLGIIRLRSGWKANENVVTAVQFRRHAGALVGLAPPEQSSKPPQNWNVKHYKSMEFWLIL